MGTEEGGWDGRKLSLSESLYLQSEGRKMSIQSRHAKCTLDWVREDWEGLAIHYHSKGDTDQDRMHVSIEYAN